MTYALAIDMGASSGRHILGWIENGCLMMEEVYRFPNEMTEKDGHFTWDTDALFHHILAGMQQCRALGKIPATVALDTWGVDYRLVDADGRPLGDAVAYRDSRTEGMMERLEETLPFDEYYRLTGIARQPFNTVYQLMADPLRKAEGARLLFLPCWFQYLLCGRMANEYTIASTSGLLNAQTAIWDRRVMDGAGIPSSLLDVPLLPPGTVLGELLPEVAEKVGYSCRVVLAASHDTASAFRAVAESMQDIQGEALYLSSGTWSLLGAMLPSPCLTDGAREAGFTNEGGVSCIRFLKNITGMWILQELRREWGGTLSWEEMIRMAEEGSQYDQVFDPGNRGFLHPDSMEGAVRQALEEAGKPLPGSRGELLYCVHRSLAFSYGRGVRELQDILGRRFTHLVILGGGSRNGLLNRHTALETGLQVVLGGTEGSAAGNLLVQLGAQENNQEGGKPVD